MDLDEHFAQLKAAMPPDLLAAHAFSRQNRAEVEASGTCGCFSCETMFQSADIADWVDDDQTALCPVCGIDAVLPSRCVSNLDRTLLGEMKKHWFEN